MAQERTQPAKERRASRSARLPQVPIARTLPVANALHELAGPATPQRIAQRLSVSPTAGAFRTTLGSAGYYGLIRQEGERRALTDLGERAIREGDEGVVAQQEAVASTGFRSVLSTFRGREANEGVIAARLQDDYGLVPSAAGQIARALIETCEQTSLIVGGRFDAEAIEGALAKTLASDGTSRAVSGRRGPERAADREGPPPRSELRAVPPTPATQVAPPARSSQPSLHIDIQLHIPATATAEQIDQIFESMAKHLYNRE